MRLNQKKNNSRSCFRRDFTKYSPKRELKRGKWEEDRTGNRE